MNKTSNRDLLKEAIADAQVVKETAIANAKAAISEAFAPHLKELFASKLEEMDKEDEESTKDLAEEKIENKSEETVKENDTVDEDLNSLLAELEEDSDTKETEEEEETEETEDTKEETKDEESEDEINVSEMSEEELKAFVEDVIKDMVESGELDSEEKEEVSMDDEDINLDELLAEAEAEEISELSGVDVVGDITSAQAIGAIIGAIALVTGTAVSVYADEIKAAAKKGKEALQNKLKDILSKNSVKESEIEEAESTIEELRNEINEVKILNAKLLYVNKIFKSKNLSNNQKVKVIETFDKAGSINEAKLIYETLIESVKEKAPINESVRGFASKSTGMSRKETIIEPNDAFQRMRKLAGLK